MSLASTLKRIGVETVGRVRTALTRVIASTIAAGVAYWLARHILGQHLPIFAAITAIVCLAPGILNHFRQSVNLLIGVSIGILVGELIFKMPYDLGELRVAVAVFAAMLIASASASAPIVPIQAGASALLVILMGPQNAGLSRFLDVIVGAATGILFAVVFFRARLNFRD
jgi:uncharacterized membrane protein YgaE (UPF0421/DUF939 family)